MVTETIIIVFIFAILAVIGLMLWKASKPAVYDPDVIVTNGEFDPHHDHYSPHEPHPVLHNNSAPARAAPVVTSGTVDSTEPEWLKPKKHVSDNTVSTEGSTSRDRRRVWDRRINQDYVSNDRRNNDRRMEPAYA